MLFECQGGKRLEVQGAHSTLCLVTKKPWGARQAHEPTGSFIHSVKDLRSTLQSDPKFRDFRIILRSDTDEGKAKPSYPSFTHLSWPRWAGKNHFVSPCVALRVLWARVSFQKRIPSQVGRAQGWGTNLLALRASKQSWEQGDVHTCDGTGGCHGQEIVGKRVPCWELFRRPGSHLTVPSDKLMGILLIAALSQCLRIRAASKMGSTVTCGNWVLTN